ncbi:hypothetical protein DdX_09147 [Ditylenchus destructor]|uniref:Uncharacterized protein n=1 Tax=Ditylenchus destructor TaxID=166010 RepID=A0AAD4R085_9BILA|nr:hypothetical protein DdX_09147 [Ditylenchus destructor]
MRTVKQDKAHQEERKRTCTCQRCDGSAFLWDNPCPQCTQWRAPSTKTRSTSLASSFSAEEELQFIEKKKKLSEEEISASILILFMSK